MLFWDVDSLGLILIKIINTNVPATTTGATLGSFDIVVCNFFEEELHT